MNEIKKYIEILEDLELDDPQGIYPLFGECVYYDELFKKVAENDEDEKRVYLTFEIKCFENVFKRKMNFVESNGKVFFKTKKAEELVEINRKNNYKIKNLPCFIIQ